MAKFGTVYSYQSKYITKDWYISERYSVNRLYYIFDGNGSYICDGEEHHFEKGKLYLFPACLPFQPIKEKCIGMGHTYSDFELLPPLSHTKEIILSPSDHPEIKEILGIFISIGNSISSGLDLGEEYKNVGLSAILFLTTYMAKNAGAKFSDDRVVIKALEIMHDRYHEKLSVEDMAKGMGMTPNGFIRHFNKILGVTPFQYLKELRLRKAIYLRNSGVSLEDTAALVGYSDAASLGHAFRNRKWDRPPQQNSDIKEER